MKLTNDPANTLAILVGIEHYADPTFSDLGGPAMDALRVADWLLREKVPAGRILLYINFAELSDRTLSAERENLLQKIVGQGVKPPCEPTCTRLQDALNPSKFMPPPNGEGGLLFIYFSGHGLCSTTRKARYVVAADTTSTSWDVINISNQADNLRLQPASCRYRQQWIIQDACAEPKENRLLRAQEIDLPETDEVMKQYRLFAARPGEFAIANPATQTGDFTSELLKILQTRTLANLDIEDAFLALEKAFEGRTHHPSITRIGTDWSARTLLPGKKTSCDARHALLAILNTLAVDPSLIDTVRYEVAQAEKPPKDKMSDAIANLDSIFPSNNCLTNIDLFAIRLASLCKRIGSSPTRFDTAKCDKHLEAYQQLDNWVTVWPGKQAMAAVDQERTRLAEVADLGRTSPIIVLHPHTENETRVWMYCDGKSKKADFLPTSKTALIDRITDAIQKVENRGWIVDNTVIELVLPFSQLFDRYTGLEILLDPKNNFTCRLGERGLVFVLRVAERWTEKPWHAAWHTRWKNIKPKLSNLPHMCRLPDEPDICASHWQWVGAVDRNDGSLLTGLIGPLKKGAPFAAWCMEADVAVVEQKLLNSHYIDLHLLFHEIGDLNKNGCNIHCIVDDPSRHLLGAVTTENLFKQPPRRK